LKNLAILHLYLQGFDNEDLSNFEIKLSSPSTIFEQEKLEIWKSKFDIASTAKEQKMVGSEFVYKEIFKFTDDDIKTRKEQVVDDSKFEYRLEQIASQGNDPAISAQHADEGGTVRQVDNPDEVDVAGDDISSEQGAENQTENAVGRPEENNPSYGTDEHDLGRDPMGSTERKKANKLDKTTGRDFKGGSAFSLEAKQMLKKIPKKFIADNKSKQLIKESDDLLSGSIKSAIDDDEN